MKVGEIYMHGKEGPCLIIGIDDMHFDCIAQATGKRIRIARYVDFAREPVQVGSTLREELERGQKAIEELAKVRADLKAVEARLDEAGDLKSLKRELETREGKLIIDEAKVREMKQEQVEFQLSTQLEAEKRFSNKLAEITMGLVRNTTYRENVYKSLNTEYDGHGGQRSVDTGHSADKTAE